MDATELGFEHMLNAFSSFSHAQKCSFLDDVINRCKLSELSYMHGVLNSIIKVDFLANLPHEIQERIIRNLDWASINSCRLVSRSWYSILDNSQSAHLVLMREMGASNYLCSVSRNLEVVKKLYSDVVNIHLSLHTSSGIGTRVIEGHLDRVCALHYSNGFLTSASHDGTARVSKIHNGISFERLIVCTPSASIKLTSSGLISAQFDGKLEHVVLFLLLLNARFFQENCVSNLSETIKTVWTFVDTQHLLIVSISSSTKICWWVAGATVSWLPGSFLKRK